MKWVESGINQQDAIEFSLAFVQDDDEAAKALGVRILAEMVGDSKMREKVLQYSTLSALLVAARDLPSGAVKEDASNCLNNLMTHDRAMFFKLWEEIDCAITDERIIKRIVKNLDTDDRALGILATLATHNDCKPIIAKTKGVEAMVKIYRANEDMSRAGVDAIISTKVLLAIDVLASLAANEECRAMFAESHATIWPLVHFVWNCSFLSTKYEEYFDKDYSDTTNGEDFRWVEETRLALTPLGRKRIIDRWGLQSEINAGKALCSLSSDKRCQHLFIDVGASIDVTSGKLSSKLEIPSRDEYDHLILTWLAIEACLLVKTTKDAEEAHDWIDPNTKTEVCFLRIAWNLFSSEDVDEKTYYCRSDDRVEGIEHPLLFESIFEDSGLDQLQCDRVLANCEDLISPGTENEQFWVRCLVLNMLIWETPSLESSHARIAKMAAMSVFETDDRGVFKRLAEHVLEHSKPSEMDSSCIPFLVQSFQKMGYNSQSSEDEESDDSEDEAPDDDWFDDADSDTDDFGKKCLIRLAFLWPAHEEQIISAGEDKIVQAIRKFNRCI